VHGLFEYLEDNVESLIADTGPNLKWFCDECDVAVMDVKVTHRFETWWK